MDTSRRAKIAKWLLLTLGCALLPWLAGPLFEAATTLVDINGHVLSVDIASDSMNPILQGVRLQDTAPSGGTTSEIIPSSLDSVLDFTPALALRPGGGVVVVWARKEGNDSELAIGVRDPGPAGWRPHLLVTADSLNDEQPRVILDSQAVAQVVWWGNGLGGPIYLQGFDPNTGQPVGPRHKPLDPPASPNSRRTGTTPETDGAGGLDDPGVPTTGSRLTASAEPCVGNPAASADHGVFLSCGGPGAFQLSACVLTVGVQDQGSWARMSVNLTTVDLSRTSVREITQSLADAYCLN